MKEGRFLLKFDDPLSDVTFFFPELGIGNGSNLSIVFSKPFCSLRILFCGLPFFGEPSPPSSLMQQKENGNPLFAF